MIDLKELKYLPPSTEDAACTYGMAFLKRKYLRTNWLSRPAMSYSCGPRVGTFGIERTST